MAKTFRAVTVTTLSNNGQSTPKYNKPVTLNINYDPQGLSVELVSGKGARRYAVLPQRGRSTTTRPTATRLIDHATDRDPGNITTLRVASNSRRFSALACPNFLDASLFLSRFSRLCRRLLVTEIAGVEIATLAPWYCHRATHANGLSYQRTLQRVFSRFYGRYWDQMSSLLVTYCTDNRYDDNCLRK